MHLSLETPTPGRHGAYVGICKGLDDLPAPRGGGIVHFRQFILYFRRGLDPVEGEMKRKTW